MDGSLKKKTTRENTLIKMETVWINQETSHTFRHNIQSGNVSSTNAEIVTVLSDRKSTRLNSSHSQISYAVFCLKKKKTTVRDSSTTHKDKILPTSLSKASSLESAGHGLHGRQALIQCPVVSLSF